ncbi:MAG: hypothetical protein GF331_01505 [Chitinivibrionales bacterium]|nr:hypothetical protein [Chitinivibrionales bacterium]
MRRFISNVIVLLALSVQLAGAARPTGWVCYAGADDGKVYRVRVGGTVEALTGNVGAKHARWSADGKLIFYINGSGKIFAMDNQGNSSWEIGTGKVLSGSSIAAYRPDPNCVLSAEDSKFYKIDAYTKKKTLVTDVNKGGIYGEIAISSDGTRVAFRDGNPTWHNVSTGTTREYNTRCSAGISPNGSRLIANNDGHDDFSLYSFNGSSHSKLRNVGYNGVLSTGDNQAFCVNSNDWVCVLVDNAGTNYGKACGIVNISTNEVYQVASWSSSKTMYPDFFLGSLPGVVQYTLTVENGSGDGSYASGATVTISANNPPSGKQFDRWTGDVANVANVNNATTTITMPAANATVTATYKDISVTQYALTVHRGTGDGQYAAQTSVTIAADQAPADSVFDKWTGDVATVANVNNAQTTIAMPAANATVRATYRGATTITPTAIVYPSDGCELVEGTTITLQAEGANVSWSYDATSDGVGSVTIGSGNSIAFTVPTGVTGAKTIVITAAGDNGSDQVSGTIKAPDVTLYPLTVHRGTGDGQYAAQETVTITADQAPADSTFDKWTGDITNVANVNSAQTTITMPADGATVTATYRKLALITATAIVSPSDGCQLEEGTTVTLTAEGSNISWSYDANSDGLGSVPIGTGNTVEFDVPVGVTGPRTITITATGDNGSDEINGSIVAAPTSAAAMHTVAAPAAFAATPNPCRGSAIITFHLKHRQRITLSLYDMTGKRVAVVADGSFGPGNHALTWQGNSGIRRGMVNGAYTAVLETASERHNLRIVVTR